MSPNAATPKVRSGTPVGEEESGDYVWDVFYHRPVTLSEWNSVAARTGTLWVLCSFYLSSLLSSCLSTGLPVSVLDPDDSGSDSEADDEADEDSNGE